MSKLAALLQSRGVTAATPATSATQRPESSKSSESSRGVPSNLSFTSDLEQRIRAMASRWQYSDNELADVIDRARVDPALWLRAVARDESHEQEYRDGGWLPKADA